MRGSRRSTPLRICAAAASGMVGVNRSNRATASSREAGDVFAPSRARLAIGVRIPPGCTQETNTDVLSSSWRSASVNPRTANLLAEYALCPAGATIPNTLEIFTICARGSFFSRGRKYFTPYTTPQKLMPISQRKSSSEISSNLPCSATPALLISSVTRPCCATTSFAKPCMADSSETSTICEVSLTPRSISEAAVCCTPASSISASARADPAAANCRASPRPIPEPAPVTTATPSCKNDIAFIDAQCVALGPGIFATLLPDDRGNQAAASENAYAPADFTLASSSTNFCLRSAWSWPPSASASCVLFMEQNLGPHMEQNLASL